MARDDTPVQRACSAHYSATRLHVLPGIRHTMGRSSAHANKGWCYLYPIIPVSHAICETSAWRCWRQVLVLVSCSVGGRETCRDPRTSRGHPLTWNADFNVSDKICGALMDMYWTDAYHLPRLVCFSPPSLHPLNTTTNNRIALVKA